MESLDEKLSRVLSQEEPELTTRHLISDSPLLTKTFKELEISSPACLSQQFSPISYKKRKANELRSQKLIDFTLDEKIRYKHHSPKQSLHKRKSRNISQFTLGYQSPQINFDSSDNHLNLISRSPLITPLMHFKASKRMMSPYKGSTDTKENNKRFKASYPTQSQEIVEWIG